MLTSVQARNAAGTVLTMTLDDITDGIILEDVEGLQPVKALISSSNFALLPGAVFQNARREPRNIVLKLGLEPDVSTSVETLRAQLYNFFMPPSSVNLRFITDEKTVEIDGIVEDFISPLFTKEPTVNIPIVCMDPDFRGMTDVEVEGDTVTSLTSYTEVPYVGTIECGIHVELLVNRTISQFTVNNTAGDGLLQQLAWESFDLVDEDIVRINTIPREKYARVEFHDDHTEVDVLYAVSLGSRWPVLKPGTNQFRIFASGDPIPWVLTYRPRYGGL